MDKVKKSLNQLKTSEPGTISGHSRTNRPHQVNQEAHHGHPGHPGVIHQVTREAATRVSPGEPGGHLGLVGFQATCVWGSNDLE